MIKTEVIGDLIKTYSDQGFKIHGGFPEGDYNEAVDPAYLGRTYIETDIPADDDISKEDGFNILIGEQYEQAED